MHCSFFKTVVCIQCHYKIFASKMLNKTPSIHLYSLDMYIWRVPRTHTVITQNHTLLFFSFKKMPFFALVISVAIISGGLAVSADSSNCLKILASTTFSSFRANCCPMQFLHSTRQHRSQS